MVTLFPPWVGEMEEERVDRRIGDEPRQGQLGVVRIHAPARREPLTNEPLVHDGGPFLLDLEGDHRDVRATDEPIDEEPPRPGPLHFEPREARIEQRADIDGVPFGEASGIGVAQPRFVGRLRVLHGPLDSTELTLAHARSTVAVRVKTSFKSARKGLKGSSVETALALRPGRAGHGFSRRLRDFGVLERCGHPAVPLDDAFIHFQYAKRFATGHLFSFSEGDGYSSGATSFLWPMLLAPFYLLGFRDWPSSGSLGSSGFLRWGPSRSRPIVSRSRSRANGRAWGRRPWCSASGATCGAQPAGWRWSRSRGCSPWAYGSASNGGSDAGAAIAERAPILLVVAVLAPFVRPEGMLVSLLAALTLVLFPAARRLSPPDALREPQRRRGVGPVLEERSPALIALIGVFAIPVLNLALTGQARSSTTLVKWLPGNPYYGHGAALAAAVRENVRILVVTLLDGREWSAVYIPSGARPFAIAALVAIPAAGWLGGRTWRALLICVMALAIALPCTYLTFLWNRLRYLWPFAFAWFVGLACLSRCVAELMGAISARLRVLGGVVSFLFACALGGQLSWTRDDLASSSSAIDRQQVKLGRWAAEYLPSSARIGLNDTGAIAYLSGKKTFDVVGLTTPGEAPYWVAGGGSRFEHYEKLYLASPERLPTHFIVYPQWMACDAVLGDPLHEATVLDQTILGAPP